MSRYKAAKLLKNQNCEWSGKPERGEARKRPAIDRQPPGPVRNRGEQETGDGGGHVAINHFVNVQIERVQMGGHTQLPHVLGNPEKNANDRPETRRQKERAEAIRKQRGAVIVAAAS